MTEEALALNRQPRRGLLPGAHRPAARARAAALAPARGRRGAAARVRGPLPAPAGVGGDAGVARVGPRQRRGGAAQRGAVRRATTSRRSSTHRTSCPPRCAWPSRRRRGRAGRGRAAVRAAAPLRGAEPVLEQHVGRLGARRRAGWGCSPPPTIGRRDAAAHFAEAVRLAEAWGARGWALRTIGDWLATGVPVADRGELVNRGLLLARELGLPGRRGADRRRGSDHHAVALDHGLRGVVEADADVALVAPVGAPAGAQQEVVRAVADSAAAWLPLTEAASKAVRSPGAAEVASCATSTSTGPFWCSQLAPLGEMHGAVGHGVVAEVEVGHDPAPPGGAVELPPAGSWPAGPPTGSSSSSATPNLRTTSSPAFRLVPSYSRNVDGYSSRWSVSLADIQT